MSYGRKIIMIAFVIFMLSAGVVYEVSAQRRVIAGRRPVIVRSYVYRDPFWRSRYWGSPFYDDYYYSPYRRREEERYYLERELAGNRRELAEHRRKYSADGIITSRERSELDDDVRD